MKQLAVILVSILLVSCSGTPYQQPSASSKSAQLTISSSAESVKVDIFGDKDCSPASAQGRLAYYKVGNYPVRIGAGERIYLRVLGKSSPTRDENNSRVFYRCTYLVSFVPEPGKSYNLWPGVGKQCSLDLLDGQTFFPPKSMERHPVSERCTSSWE